MRDARGPMASTVVFFWNSLPKPHIGKVAHATSRPAACASLSSWRMHGMSHSDPWALAAHLKNGERLLPQSTGFSKKTVPPPVRIAQAHSTVMSSNSLYAL